MSDLINVDGAQTPSETFAKLQADYGYQHDHATFDIPTTVNSLPYPVCAMALNGIILEDEVPGYRTIRVEGRETFSNTIYDYSTRLNPGSRFQGAHEGYYEISITFAVHAYNYKDLYEKLDHLRGILLSESNHESQIIFADEWDKYYVGTVSKFTTEKLVNNQNAAGQITIRCSDVRKYKVEPSEVLVANRDNGYRFEIDYHGIRPAYPIINAKMPSEVDIDYFGFINQDGKILQFGTIQDVGDDRIEKPTTRINQDFRKTYPSTWGKPQDTPTPSTMPYVSDSLSTFLQIGQNYEITRDTSETSSGIRPSINSSGVITGYGTWDSEDTVHGYWHGPTTTRLIEDNGATNWKFTSLLTQWQKEPKADAVNVVLKNDYVVIACVNNKSYFKPTINIPFAAYEGSKQIPCELVSYNKLFNIDPQKTQPSKNNADGLVQFIIPKDTTISDTNPSSDGNNNEADGLINLVFKATYSGGTKQITKQFHWVRNNFEPVSSATYDIIFRQYDFRIKTVSQNNQVKAAEETTIKVPFAVYKGSTRVACNAPATSSIQLFGITPSVSNSTSTADGYIQWVIPSGTRLTSLEGVNSVGRTITFSLSASGQTIELPDRITIRKNDGSDETVSGYSGITVPLGQSEVVLPCKTENKTFLEKEFKLIFGGWEGTVRKNCVVKNINDIKILGVKPTVENATKEKNGSITWIIPANKVLSEETSSIVIQFEVETTHRGKTTIYRRLTIKRELLTDTITDYTQLGGLAIIISGDRMVAGGDAIHQSIAEIQFFKNKTNSTQGTCNLYLDNIKKAEFKYDCIRTGAATGTDNGKNKNGATVEIEHIGNQYVFTVAGKKYPFTNSNNLIATAVTFFFLRFKNNNVLERNSVKTAKFIKYPILNEVSDTITTQGVIRNLVYTDDDIVINCGTGEVNVNGVEKYGYGQLGNDWEDFCLTPGPNVIQCVFDDYRASYQGNIYINNQDFIRNGDYKRGDYWIAQNEGTILSKEVQVGDTLIAIRDKGQDASDADFVKMDRVDPEFTLQYREVY